MDRVRRAPFHCFFFVEFLEQLLRQNQNRRLTRDDRPIDFISYIFHAIDSLRSTIA